MTRVERKARATRRRNDLPRSSASNFWTGIGFTVGSYVISSDHSAVAGRRSRLCHATILHTACQPDGDREISGQETDFTQVRFEDRAGPGGWGRASEVFGI